MDTEVRDRDMQMKEKGKEYGDKKRRATESDIGIGDKVFVKNIVKENKLTPKFNPDTHTVTNVTNSDVTVRHDETGKEYRRNVVHLKKVNGSWEIINVDDSNDNIVDSNENLSPTDS